MPQPAEPLEPLLGIGDFSRYAGLSVRMLRHYDERGVLRPAEVDPFTGYRRYTADQLGIAGRIRALRDAGCGIPLITEMLALYDTPDELRARLAAHIADLEGAARDLEAQRRRALSVVSAIGHGDPVVGERMLPAARVLWLRRTVACYPAEGELWGDLRTLLGSDAGIDPAGLGDLVGTTYFDEEYRDDDVEMAIWRDYNGAFEPRSGFEVRELPAVRVAWTTHYGDFDTIDGATRTLGAWIAAQGYRRAGALFNVYVMGPGREPDPTKWVTEVNVPIG